MSETSQQGRRVLRAPAVLAKTGHKNRVSLWRFANDPKSDFPRPIRIGPNAVGWFEDEVDAWLESRPRIGCAGPSEQDASDAAAA